MNLEAEKISFSYLKNEPVLKEVTLRIQSGEKVGVFAPSGRGKTTLCKILAGYYKPQLGIVTCGGTDVYKIKGYHPVQMIWQHPEEALNPRLRMKEALKEVGGVPSYILKELGIQERWLNRFPGELSGGELQRFCIARALGEKTKMLIADEITSMLDVITQAQIWHFIQEEVKTRNLGLLMVTHHPALIEQICTRRVFL